jgi:hypothetical protein
LNNNGFKVAVFDPFFKEELVEKYLIENKLERQNFEVLKNLELDTINEFNCLCIVQHHTKVESKLEDIYNAGIMPLIYDCQNKISKKPNSKTILKTLGR